MRGMRTARAAGLIAIAAALIVPATAPANPTATKSGVLVNYVGPAKLKIGKNIRIQVICSANCTLNTTTTFKGPALNQRYPLSGQLAANSVGGPFFKLNGPALKAMKSEPGKFKVLSSITGTNQLTGAVETISRTFKLKR